MGKIVRTRIMNPTTRTTDDGKMMVEGYAAVFDSETVIWESSWDGWKYKEVIDPEAFKEANIDDVIFNYNHMDQAMILARTTNNTLDVSTDSKGLKISAEIADTTAGKDVYTLIKRGDLAKMSFAFDIKAATYEDDMDAKESIRRITKIGTLYDVAVVDRPAYDDTSIEARSDISIQTHDEKRVHDLKEQRKHKLILMTY